MTLRVVGQALQQRVRHAARARLQDAAGAGRTGRHRSDAVGTVRVVVELDDDVGITVAVGNFVQRVIEFVMPLAGRFGGSLFVVIEIR